MTLRFYNIIFLPIKIIAYSRLNRVDEALNEAMNLLNETDARGRKQYFNSLTVF
jgi:hypothetical protein